MFRRRSSRKRNRSSDNSERRSTGDNEQSRNSTSRKRRRRNSSSRNEIPSENSTYNLRPRRRSTTNEIQQSERSSTNENPFSTVAPARQYRFLYISDEEDLPTNSVPQQNSGPSGTFSRRTSRTATTNLSSQTRSRTTTEPTTSNSMTATENNEASPSGTAPLRLNRAIEIVIDSIQSLEGMASNFDQLVFGLIYGRLSTRNEYENSEGMIRLSRILNYNLSSRLTQAEIEALPKIKFQSENESLPSVLLAEKCPICLTEFSNEEIINKLHCSHLFHQECISTWLGENDSCPTCRRKVNAE